MTIQNARVLVEGEGIRRTSISFNERIDAIGEDEGDDADALSFLDDALILPGFIDEHIHGGYGVDFRDDDVSRAVARMASCLPMEGTTSFLATEAAQSHIKTHKTLRALRAYREENHTEGARLLGVHLEGPYVARSYCGGLALGALRLPDISSFQGYEGASGGSVKLVTLAPELEGAEELIGYLRGHGIVVSLGHTAATFQQMERAVRAGASNVTHTYNAMSGFFHREAGAVGAALIFNDLACELIADCVHVGVPAMQLLVKCKSPDKIILITDSICFKGMGRDGEFIADGKRVLVKNGEPRLESGKLAGSVLSMNRAVCNMIEQVGVSLEEAVNYATINPARALGVDADMGSIRVGKYADFAVVDPRFNVICTVRGGKVVYRAN